jgi:Zn-dependent M28 family amino/carboxypeptidase
MPHIVAPAFDGARAFDLLTAQTAFGPRNPGSIGHGDCLRYLVTTLSRLADSVRTEPFTVKGYDNEFLHLTNVVAQFRPLERSRVLLCAHWDTRPRADREQNRARQNEPIPGANDGASGVAVLLELASLMNRTPPPVGVDIVLFDGEDYGREGDLEYYLLGSRHFARTVSALPPYRFGILLDMVGDTFLEIPRELNSIRLAPAVVEMVWGTAQDLGFTQFVNIPGEAVHDDHIPLNEAGIPTVDIIDFNYPDATNRYWHTHQDSPEHCSPESLEAVGTVVAHVIYAQRP